MCREKGRDTTGTTGNDSERQINNNLVYHYERIQPNDQPGYESVDVGQQRHNSQGDRMGSRCKGGNYNVAEAAKNISSEDIRQNARERNRQDAQPRGKQNAVYAVVDKSKKRSKRRLRVVLVLPLHRKCTQKSSTMNGAVSLGRIGSGMWWERAVDKNNKGYQGVPSLNFIQMRWKGCLNSLTFILTFT